MSEIAGISKEIIAEHKKAGQISQTALKEGAKLIKIGFSMKEVLDTIEERIIKAGGNIAFPAQISLNNIAAHYCPNEADKTTFKEGDMAKLDIGVHINGRIADNAMTINLGADDAILQASKEGLAAALKIIRPGITLGEIGRTISEAIQSFDLQAIHNLSGHGLGHYNIHTKPSIPNFDTKDTTELEEGQVIAIEPFATNGVGLIYESGNPTIFTHVANKGARSPYARSILSELQTYQHLPFASRWLERKQGAGKVRLGLSELQRNGSIISHPPLLEKQNGMVSQHEHSVIVAEKPIIFTKIDDD